MVLDTNTAKTTAAHLLQINAIKLKPENPFTWASGWKSPIYCDNRILLSHPSIRNYIKTEIAKQVTAMYGTPDCIAGVATGAIGIGALVADILNLPFIYVRPEPKAHGRKNQIEGRLEKNQTVVVIEDLISTGNSSLNAVAALKEQGATVLGMLAIFSYGFDTATQNFLNSEIQLHTLSNYDYLLEEASETGYINQEQLTTLSTWKGSPSTWLP